MCSSEGRRRDDAAAPTASGFTLLELLIALTLALLVALACAPLWVSLQKVTVAAADRLVWGMQARVATARLERDIRLAGVGFEGSTLSADSSNGPLLAAESRCVVLVTRLSPDSPPELVEWELTGDALMRRRGLWTGAHLASPTTRSLYTDHKTMLEGLDDTSSFGYTFAQPDVPLGQGSIDASFEAPEASDLRWIQAVIWNGRAKAAEHNSSTGLSFTALIPVAR